jgi:2-oxoisovalerate dehydrogenase E1 component
MRGHEEASGVKYVPKELFEIWGEKDPLANYEKFLLESGVMDEMLMNQIREQHRTYIEKSLEIGFAEPPVVPNVQEEMKDVYAPHVHIDVAAQGEKRPLKLIQAISEGMAESMKRYPNLVLMGQDIAEYGGAFKATEGFVEQFGKDRVRNTPLCESAIVGSALGLSIKGFKSMMEMQFSDFVTVGFNQIINNLAKIYYRWGQHADVVIRMPTGGGVGAGPFHSQSTEAWFTHTPGLKVVYPSTPEDAKGLMLFFFSTGEVARKEASRTSATAMTARRPVCSSRDCLIKATSGSVASARLRVTSNALTDMDDTSVIAPTAAHTLVNDARSIL